MYTFDSRIRYSETDSEGKLTLCALINYFQDCSTFQSEDIGRGLQFLKEHDLAWVLCSWQIVVDRYPKMGEKVTIGTFLWIPLYQNRKASLHGDPSYAGEFYGEYCRDGHFEACRL